MNVWIRRFRSLFSPVRAAPMVPVLLNQSDHQHGLATSPRSGAPPITELDLLRAFGCDV
ncbi:hypothetical protein [Deinococcus sp. AJ005]|uniref:hypothetical protein n=1 Tax=Deinococcus sp. AJ005 TaxID=2652443 RepID=UPI00186573E9|nr:hypothetical protein [Deinococcus sp. AJ005]